MTIISTVTDLRNWVDDHIGGDCHPSDPARVTEVIRCDPNRPNFGADWTDYLRNLPDLVDLAEMNPRERLGTRLPWL